jgi:hypothetical protein
LADFADGVIELFDFLVAHGSVPAGYSVYFIFTLI